MVEVKSEKISDDESAIPFLHRVIAEVRPFMGVRAAEFVFRQCTHIRTVPEFLSKEQIPLLAFWMKNSARLILSKEKTEQLYENVMELSK